MKAVGIVVEYNPFHNGHRYHLQEARKHGDVVIAIMSGDFVQRGEPALINRWRRTEMALRNGVDMVVELPAFYSTQSAEIFARGSIGMLEHLKVEKIVFGSEMGDRDFLESLALLEEREDFKESLKRYLGEGNSYPTAHSKASCEIFGSGRDLNPNDILGLEYIKALRYWNSKVEPIPIKRMASGYHSEEISGGIASATAIRKSLGRGTQQLEGIVPLASLRILLEEYEGDNMVSLKDFYPFIRYEILKNHRHLQDIQDMERGFENRLYECALINTDFESFYEEAMSKRFTRGRFQRILIHILLGITYEMTQEVKREIPYIRVLGFSGRGRKYLKKLGGTEVPILTTFKNIQKKLSPKERELLEINELAGEIYSMVKPYGDRKLPIMLDEEGMNG